MASFSFISRAIDEYLGKMNEARRQGDKEKARYFAGIALGYLVEAENVRGVAEEYRTYYRERRVKLEEIIRSMEIGGVEERGVRKISPHGEERVARNVQTNTRFSDIAGLQYVKELLNCYVRYPIEHPDVEQRYKKELSNTRLVLLYGPPGTGKTMFADALANELQMSVHRAKACEIIDPYLGVSGQKIRNFIEAVRTDTSARILAFIDEFDALAPRRTEDAGGADGEMKRLVNTILQEIDDLGKSNRDRQIVFLATTNRPQDIDPAVLRGKRFDTQIYVGLPDRRAREYLIKEKHFGGGIPPLAPGLSLDGMVERLKGYSAADISAICEKIGDEPRFRHYHTGKAQCVTEEDVNRVIGAYRNSVTPDMLREYYEYNPSVGEEVFMLD